MIKEIRSLTGEGNVLATVWNNKVVVSAYLSDDLKLVDVSGDVQTKSKVAEKGTAELGSFKDLLVIVMGYSNQTLAFYNNSVPILLSSLILVHENVSGQFTRKCLKSSNEQDNSLGRLLCSYLACTW